MWGPSPKPGCLPSAGPVEAKYGKRWEEDVVLALLPCLPWETRLTSLNVSKDWSPSEGFLKHKLQDQKLIFEVWKRAQEFAFLTNSQVLMPLLVQGPHFAKGSVRPLQERQMEVHRG